MCRNEQGSPVYVSPASQSCGYIIPTLDHGGTMFSMYLYHCAYFVKSTGQFCVCESCFMVLWVYHTYPGPWWDHVQHVDIQLFT